MSKSQVYSEYEEHKKRVDECKKRLAEITAQLESEKEERERLICEIKKNLEKVKNQQDLFEEKLNFADMQMQVYAQVNKLNTEEE